MHDLDVQASANPVHLVSPRTVGTEAWQHQGQDAAPSDGAREALVRVPSAFLATIGAVVTAILGSACCWLPVLLIALGVSAAGVGRFFEEYGSYFLAATLLLLAAAWYFTYRTAMEHAWAWLRGRPGTVPAILTCCTPEADLAAAGGCGSTGPGVQAGEGCAALVATDGRRFARPRVPVRRGQQVLLWLATALIALVALFPHRIGRFVSSKDRLTVVTPSDDVQQVVLHIQGLTCEGCAAAIEQALRGVSGVPAASVHYKDSEARVFVPKG